MIPLLHGGDVHRVRIRRAEPSDGLRYYLLAGSSTAPMVLSGNLAVIVVLESELDAILVHQEAGDLTGAIAMGSASMRPDARAAELLRKADTILVALDGDDRGAKESWTWWREHFPQARRWPPVGGKDPGEMRAAGVDVRAWGEAGIVDAREQRQKAAQHVQNEHTRGTHGAAA